MLDVCQCHRIFGVNEQTFARGDPGRTKLPSNQPVDMRHWISLEPRITNHKLEVQMGPNPCNNIFAYRQLSGKRKAY